MSESTVERALSFAKRAGLIVDAEDKILQDLVPSALNVIKASLEGEEADPTVALEILKGVGLLKKSSTGPNSRSSASVEEEDLHKYIERVRREIDVEQLPQSSVTEATLLPASTGGDGDDGDQSPSETP